MRDLLRVVWITSMTFPVFYHSLGIGYTGYSFGYTVFNFRIQTFIYIYIYIYIYILLFFYFFIFIFFFMNLGIYIFSFIFFSFFIFIFNFFFEFRHLNLVAQCLLLLWNLPCITPWSTLNFVRIAEDLTTFSTMNLEFMTHTSHIDISPICVQ